MRSVAVCRSCACLRYFDQGVLAVLLLLLSIAPLWAQSGVPAQVFNPLAEARAAPEFGLVALDGQECDLTDFEGRVILVNFWATWCPPCRKEMPALERLAQHFQVAAFEVVGVNVGESVERVRDFLQTLPVLPAFPMLMDPDGSVSQAWHARVVPTTWVVDGNGRMVLGAVGEVDFDSPDLRGQIQALMPGSRDAAGIGQAPMP
jgi:thiol-disulfide isomerase/thioredoxin